MSASKDAAGTNINHGAAGTHQDGPEGKGHMVRKGMSSAFLGASTQSKGKIAPGLRNGDNVMSHASTQFKKLK